MKEVNYFHGACSFEWQWLMLLIVPGNVHGSSKRLPWQQEMLSHIAQSIHEYLDPIT
jgi:hypothetical protein